MKSYTLFLAVLLFLISCNTKKGNYIFDNGEVKIKQLSQNSYQHISYLATKSFGNVPCNGMIVVDNGEAIIVDTPVANRDSDVLIDWVEKKLKSKIVGVVVTHFHVDCLGGLASFHKHGIPSYASQKTIDLAIADNSSIPQISFDEKLELAIGNKILKNEFIGEGHTVDNIVSYFPSEKILFGGCLIKSIGAGKGNLKDANVKQWPLTVEQVKMKYKEAMVVIPGHGKSSGKELLDFTIDLFSEK